MALTLFVTGDWFKDAKKVVLKEGRPKSVEHVIGAVSAALGERVGRILYMDEAVQLYVELEDVTDLHQNVKLKVYRSAASDAARRRAEIGREGGSEGGGGGGGGGEGEREGGREGGRGRGREGLGVGAVTGWVYLEPTELPSVVSINVGGRLFSTSKDTLTRCEESYLAAVFSGRIPISRDIDGHLFIDRDPSSFQLVLNFLRDETVPVPRDAAASEALLAEARYFQLPALEELVQTAWKQVLVLTYLSSALTGLCHTVHVDGPPETVKALYGRAVSVVGHDGCSFSLDASVLSLNLDAAHGGVEVDSHGLGGINHRRSLLGLLLREGWEIHHQGMCGGVEASTDNEGEVSATASTLPPTTYATTSAAVRRALYGTTEAVVGAGAKPTRRDIIVTRYTLRR